MGSKADELRVKKFTAIMRRVDILVATFFIHNLLTLPLKQKKRNFVYMNSYVNKPLKTTFIVSIIFMLSLVISSSIVLLSLKHSIEWIGSSFISDSPYGTDAQEVAAHLNRLFCKSFGGDRCSVSIFNGTVLVAQSPNSPVTIGSRFYDLNFNFLLSRTDPPLRVIVNTGPTMPLNGIPLAISLSLSALFASFTAFAIQQREKAQTLRLLKEKSDELIKSQAISNLASQISHDVRSPLAALNMVVGSLGQLPEEKRLLIRSSVQRINDIANNLLEQGKIKKEVVPKNRVSSILLAPLIDSLTSEKRAQFRDKMAVQIECDIQDGYGIFSMVDPVELKRVLSNLINNSIEAFPSSGGKVSVKLSKTKNRVQISVADNGKGIPKEMLARIGEKGVSHGNEGSTAGSGLGLFHAKSTIESFLGNVSIESFENKGTSIVMQFPIVNAPNWFVSKVILSSNQKVIVLDDDMSVHSIWRGRLQSLNVKNRGIELIGFTSGLEFKNWVHMHSNEQNSNCLYLIDYELLGQDCNGLDILQELEIGPRAILVSSRFEEQHIVERCATLGVRLIPKSMAGFVPMSVIGPLEKFGAVLIDDDSLVHQVWKMSAAETGKRFACFFTFEEFHSAAATIDRDSPIYIDANLGDNIRGEDVANQILEMEFTKVFIATGYAADEIRVSSAVMGVVGKDPPP